MALIPNSVQEITVDWLNSVLPDGMNGVSDMHWEDLGEGVGILGEVSRLHLTYDESSDGPKTIIAKCQSPAPENIFLCQVMGFYFREVNFYQKLTDTLPVKVPACYYSDISDDGIPFVLLIEEISDITILDQINGADVDSTKKVFSELAKLHAYYWESEKLYALDWLPPMNNDMYKGSSALAEEKLPSFKENWGEIVDSDVLNAVEKFIPNYGSFLDWAVSQGNQTFTHTDCRCENYLFGPESEITMIDFQLATRFWGVWDISNWLSASLTVEMRRSHENELVDHYYKELVNNGVENYSLDQCWSDLKACLMMQTFSQVIVSDLDGSNERGNELLGQFIIRTFTAAQDHELPSFIESLDF